MPRVKSEFEEISCLSWEPGPEEAAQQEERMMMDDVELLDEFSGGFSAMRGMLYDLKRSKGGGFTRVAPDGKVLGVHMLGNPCSEFVCAACMAITNGLTVEQLRRTVFPHPTVSEILKEGLMNV